MSLRYSPSLMQTVGPKRWRRPHNWASSCCNMKPIVSCTPATGCVDHKSLYACGGATAWKVGDYYIGTSPNPVRDNYAIGTCVMILLSRVIPQIMASSRLGEP